MSSHSFNKYVCMKKAFSDMGIVSLSTTKKKEEEKKLKQSKSRWGLGGKFSEPFTLQPGLGLHLAGLRLNTG